MSDKVTLTVSGLKADIEGGLTRPEIAEKYSLSVGQIKEALKQAGLDKMRAKKAKFELVVDTKESGSNRVEDVPQTSHAPNLAMFEDAPSDNETNGRAF